MSVRQERESDEVSGRRNVGMKGKRPLQTISRRLMLTSQRKKDFLKIDTQGRDRKKGKEKRRDLQVVIAPLLLCFCLPDRDLLLSSL